VERHRTRKENSFRMLFYLLGLLILALGLTLNTKAGMGVSPIISVAYTVSFVTGKSFGDMMFLLYALFVAAEIILHCAMKKGGGEKLHMPLKRQLISDLLQVPMAYLFTRFMNLFSDRIPQFDTELAGTLWGSIGIRAVLLLLAILLTGFGAAMSLNARIVPNPADGIVQVMADVSGKSAGLMKNAEDITCLVTAAALGLAAQGRIIGIGIGTVMAMLLTGRAVALYNYLFYARTSKLSGML